MSPIAHVLLMAGLGYLSGSIPFGVIVGRMKGVDPRTCGSGNIGATNVLRVLGVGPGIAVLVLDILKGWFPVWLAQTWQPSGVAATPAAVLAVSAMALLGHGFSVFLRFGGGKAVATGCGVLLALNWHVAFATAGVFLMVLAVTRYVSVASISAAFSSVVFMAFFVNGTPAFGPYVALTVLAAVFVAWKHRGNIARLRAGTEPRFGTRGRR
jgi:glycerol-3-phosphate acyltransferase PlsY